MARYVVDLSAKAIVRRHRSLHVSARTEEEAVRKASAYFKKALASRDNKLVGEIKTDSITVFGKKGGL